MRHSDVRRDSVHVGSDIDTAPQLMLIARSAPGEPPTKLTAALEIVIRELDPDFKRESIGAGVWLRENSTNDFLVQSAVAGLSGGVILMLAATGICGVVGLMVATRARRFASTRARHDLVRRRKTRDAWRRHRSHSYGRPHPPERRKHGDPTQHVENLAYAVGAAIAVLVAVVASLIPARRAASVQPMAAIRSE